MAGSEPYLQPAVLIDFSDPRKCGKSLREQPREERVDLHPERGVEAAESHAIQRRRHGFDDLQMTLFRVQGSGCLRFRNKMFERV